MNSYDDEGFTDVARPDDVLTDQQLDRFPGEPDKSNIGSFGDEEWVYEDGTRVYGVEAYGFLSELIEDDVLDGERGLTDIDMEKLRHVAAQVKGVKSPVAWVDEGMYERTGIEEDLPLDGRFYFRGQVPMSTEVRGSEDLANRLSFLRSPAETDAEEVMDDVGEVDEGDAGMIDWINGHLRVGDLVVPMVYSSDGQPVRSRKAALVYRPEDQSGLSDDFEKFVQGLSGRKTEALKAELSGYRDSGSGRETVSIDPGMQQKAPELERIGEEGPYKMTFYAWEYESSDELEVDLSGDEISVLDPEGEEVTSRDVEFDRYLDEEDLEGLDVEDVEVRNGVGEVILSDD